jgi:hypothetical protein
LPNEGQTNSFGEGFLKKMCVLCPPLIGFTKEGGGGLPDRIGKSQGGGGGLITRG